MPAPGLREVAEVWWDVARDPEVAWRGDRRTFLLVDPGDAAAPLLLAELAAPVDDPAAFASVLADGLAACDFPPTADRAAPGRVRATLAAAGRAEQLRQG